jgi:transcriptional regulator with XRE-family HTH domain
MPAIGATLREARMRARIDIAQIESETKIRAKYLRALENEEWDLLPGPTYVKSFLRTYADALGLDSRLLLEEYKLRHERLSDIELQPIAPPGRRDAPAGRRRGGIPRAYVVWFLVLAVLAGVYILGKSSEDNSNGTSKPPTTPASKTAPSKKRSKSKQHAAAPAPRVARLQVLATGPVYVCLKAAGARTLVKGEILTPNASTKTFRSSRFDLTLGNGNAKLRVNGKTLSVPPVQSGIGYRITVKGRHTLSPSARPTCK